MMRCYICDSQHPQVKEDPQKKGRFICDECLFYGQEYEEDYELEVNYKELHKEELD